MANSKFTRNYERSRGYLKELDKYGPKLVLNTLYNIYPVAFEAPQAQQAIRKVFQAFRGGELDLFKLNLARLFRRSSARKVAICCMPKSGSTFLQHSLTRLPKVDFGIRYLQSPYMNPDFVESLCREHEIDELALLSLEMSSGNWVSHMHTKWTPYTEKIFRAFGIKPIVTYRNIFDCLVSMDDMIMAGQVGGFPMIRPPLRYREMPQDERLELLCGMAGPWYLDYAVSWSRTKMDVLRLHYDDDIRGFGEVTAEKLRQFLGLEDIPREEFLRAFELTDDAGKKLVRLNKGVSGRGEVIPAAARERLRALSKPYEAEVDFSRLL